MKKILLINGIGPAACALIVWILYVFDAAFGYDIIALLKGRGMDKDSAKLYLILAIVATPVCLAVAVLQVRKALSLARRGVEVVGEVTKVTAFPSQQLVRLECRYAYRTQSHTYAWSDAKDGPGHLSVGDPICLIVDPANPKRCMRRDEVLPGVQATSTQSGSES